MSISVPSLMPMPKLQFFNNSGVPLASGLLYTYYPGTTNPLVTYTDSTGLVQNTNPVVCDSAGRASIWINSPLRVDCYDASNNLQWTQDNVSVITGLQTITGIPWVDAMSQGSLQATVTTLGTNNPVTVWVTTPVSITSNFTIPSNITLVVLSTGSISVGAGLTLTINGPFQAGLYRVFYGSGTIVFGSSTTMLPEWNGTGTSLIPTSVQNYFINGSMRIDQRNNGAAQTFTAGAAIAYCVDRWYASCTGANITGQQVAGTGSFAKMYKFTGLASNTGTLFGQRIESSNAAPLKNATVAVSAEIASSSITSVTWTAYYANSADNFSAKTQIATGTLTITSTPATYSFNFNAGANAGNGICVEFTTGALLGTQTLQYTGLQLEQGASSTGFQNRSIGSEWPLCKRYYYVLSSANLNDLYCRFGSGFCNSTTSAEAIGFLLVPMRTLPTPAANGNFAVYSGSGSVTAVTNMSLKGGTDNFHITATVAAGLTAGQGALVIANNNNTANITFNAEL